LLERSGVDIFAPQFRTSSEGCFDDTHRPQAGIKELIQNSSVFEIRIVCRAGDGNVSRFFYVTLCAYYGKSANNFFL
jgi:hypothetical protein